MTQCAACGNFLAAGALACSECRALVYARELDAMARQARSLEDAGEFAQARAVWVRSLAMLPADAKQAEWMREHLRAMEAAHPDAAGGDAAGAGAKKSNHAWAKKFGPLAPLLIFLAKFKGLFFLLLKFKFLFSFLSFIWLYVLIYGWWYGLGFAASIFIHEMGHFVEIKRRGYPAEMPVFLPGLGAYVRWQAMGVTVGQAARVSLAGPLAGWLAAVVCLLMYLHTHNPVWAALARTGAVLNLMNLIPVWVLDGAKALDALDTQERLWLLVVCGAVGWIFSQWFFALVAAGIAWRIFTAMRAKRKNNPAQMDWGAWAYYAGLLIALGALMHVTPVMQGISRR